MECLVDLLSPFNSPGKKKNLTKLSETVSKPSNTRMVHIFLYPNNRTETRTKRVPEYPKNKF